MNQYLDLMRHLREHGTFKSDRTGTCSVFGYQWSSWPAPDSASSCFKLVA